MKFLDVRTDFAFKKVFGSEHSKSKLISFLNAIIYSDRPHKIKDLTIVDPYTIPIMKGIKDTYVDVKAILDDDTKVIIEMQVLNHKGFEKRILYNAAKNYSIQLNKKDDYILLNPVIALSIVDFVMFEDIDKVVTNFKLLEKTEFINYSDDIELIFVELPKFKKELEEVENIKDQWIYFVKNAGSLEYIPNNIDKEIKDALESVNEAIMTPEELEAQYKRREFISIQKLALLKADEDGFQKGLTRGLEKGLQQGLEQGLEKGLEQGLEKGLEQGKLEGEKQKAFEIAKVLLSLGDDIAKISRATGLSYSEIEKII